MKLLEKFRNKATVAVMQADEKRYFDNLPRIIGPSTIEEFPRYIKINDTLLCRCIVAGIPPTSDLSGYPSELNPRVIDELMGLSNDGYKIAYSFAVLPIANVEAMKMLDKAMYSNKVSQASYIDKKGNDPHKQPPLKKVLEHSDFTTNYTEIFKGHQKMFHTAFIIMFYGASEDDLREAESHIKVILESNMIYHEAPDYRQLDTFISAQPFPFSKDYTFCELFSYHTSALLGTRNTNSRTDEVGLIIGVDAKTGKDIMININALSSGHMLIVGPTGSGKTFTSMFLLMRAMTMLRKRIIYLTPKADMGTNYRATCQHFGGSVIDIGRGEGYSSINPMQIMMDSNYKGDYINVFDDHFRLLQQFFTVLFGELTSNQISYLNESSIKAYKDKGILREAPDTWVNKDVVFPTLADLRAVWEEDAKDTQNVTAQAMCSKSFQINTAWSFLNKPTNIDLSSNFIVIDISNVPDDLKDALNVFTTGVMQMRFRTDSTKQTVLMVDEGGVFLRNKDLSAFLLRALTQGRSFGVSLWLATQQPSDLQKVNLSEEFRTNMPLSIVLGNMRRDTVDIVKNFFKLDNATTEALLTSGVGEGLLLVADEKIPIKFIPTKLEERIIKGKAHETLATPSGIALVHESLYSLMNEQGIIFNDWIQTEDSILDQQYETRRPQNALGLGPVKIWLKKGLRTGELIGNESVDHYALIAQVAGYLAQKGYSPTISHQEGSDLTFTVNQEPIFFEYEHGEQSPEILQKKKHDTTTGRLVFISNKSNHKYLCENVGEENVVPRGLRLLDFIEDLIEKDVQKLEVIDTTTVPIQVV